MYLTNYWNKWLHNLLNFYEPLRKVEIHWKDLINVPFKQNIYTNLSVASFHLQADGSFIRDDFNT